jgi:hypothetical protein
MNMTQNLNAVSQAQNESQVSAPGTSATDTSGSTVSSLTSGSNTLTTLGATTTFELGGTNTLGFPFSTSSGTLCKLAWKKIEKFAKNRKIRLKFLKF